MPHIPAVAADRRGVSKSVLDELLAILSREQEVLDQLAGALRAGSCTEPEISELRTGIANLEVHRAIATRDLALEMGLTGEPTLQELVVMAPEEWAPVLATQRRALTELTEELRALSRPAPAPAERNIITMPANGPGVHRSLRDFLA